MPTTSARPMPCAPPEPARFERFRDQGQQRGAEQCASRKAHQMRQHAGARTFRHQQEYAGAENAENTAERGEDENECERAQRPPTCSSLWRKMLARVSSV